MSTGTKDRVSHSVLFQFTISGNKLKLPIFVHITERVVAGLFGGVQRLIVVRREHCKEHNTALIDLRKWNGSQIKTVKLSRVAVECEFRLFLYDFHFK